MKENFYEDIVKNSNIAYGYHQIIVDENENPIDYRFIDINHEFERATGLLREDILGKTIREIFPNIGENKFDWIGEYGEIALKGGSREYERYSELLNRHYRVRVYSNEKYYFITTFIDISREKRQIEWKNIIINSMDNIILVLDENYIVKNIMVRDDSLLFYNREEMLGKNILDLFKDEPSKFNLFKEKLEEAYRSEEIESLKYRLEREEREKHVLAKLRYLKEDGIGKYIVSISDISKEEKLNAKILEISSRVKKSEKLLKQIIDSIPMRIFWKDKSLNYLGCNKKFLEDSGFKSREDIIGKNDYEMVWEKYADLYRMDDIKTIESGKEKLNFEEKVNTSRENEIWVRTSKIPLYDENDQINGVLGIFEDISERKKIEGEIVKSKERYDQLSRESRSIAFETDVDGVFTFISSVVEDVLGYRVEELLGKKSVYEIVPKEDLKDILEKADEIQITGENLVDFQHRLLSREGNPIWFITNGSILRDESGQSLGFRGICIDISKLKEKEDQIKYLSFHDQLTGLYNRRFYEEELRRLDTDRNLPISIIMADANGLKLVNDSFGHKAGDLMLKKIAHILKKNCRREDVVARIGGDEFSLILPRTDKSRVEEIIKNIEEDIKKEKIVALDLSVSIGYGIKNTSNLRIEDIINMADTEMYRKKTKMRTNFRSQSIEEIKRYLFDTIKTEESHGKLVAEISLKIGQELKLASRELEELRRVAKFHDIGKVAIDRDILEKPGELNDDEWKEIKRHPEVSYIILSSSPEYIGIADYALYHHERWDGKGYPKGLKGEEIPLISRIINVADAFEAITSNRPYRKKRSVEEALEIIKGESKGQFDPRIVEALVKLIEKKS